MGLAQLLQADRHTEACSNPNANMIGIMNTRGSERGNVPAPRQETALKTYATRFIWCQIAMVPDEV
jgi:hypothetical protein